MSQWYLRTQDETFGPESEEKLVEWARLGRIQPGQEISEDNEVWRRVEDVPFLDMRFSIDIGDGNPRGPFNRVAAEALLASGRLPPTATMVESREPFDAPAPSVEPESQPEPEPQHEPAPSVEPEPQQEPESQGTSSQVEPEPKIIEKIVEVPVEKIVEKIVEVEKPPRTTVVVPEILEPAGNEPPRRSGGKGMFGDVSRSGLEALEQAARRELAAAGKSRFSFFGRKKA